MAAQRDDGNVRVIHPAPSDDQRLPEAHGATVALLHLALHNADTRAAFWLERLARSKHAIPNEALRLTAQIIGERHAAGKETDTLILLDELERRGVPDAVETFPSYAPELRALVGENYVDEANIRLADTYAQQIIQAAKSRELWVLGLDAARTALRNEPGESELYAKIVQDTLRAWDDLLADATGGSPFKARRLSELLKRPRPAVIDSEMRLKEHQLGLVYALSNVGKSLYVTWRVCEHASAGRNVVYITGEGQYEIGARVMAAVIAHGLDAEMVEEHLRIIERTPKLLDAAQVAAVIEQISDAFDNDDPITLIALDTLSTAIPGQDQNDNGVMTAAADGMRDIMRAFDCAGILVHHSGKDTTKGERGASALRDTVDLSIELTREEGSDVVVAIGKKARDGEKDWREAYTVTTQALDEYADNVSATIMPGAEMPVSIGATRQPRENSTDRKMLEVLASLTCGMRRGAWIAEAERMFSIKPETARKSIERLLAAGKVYVDADQIYRVKTLPDS